MRRLAFRVSACLFLLTLSSLVPIPASAGDWGYRDRYYERDYGERTYTSCCYRRITKYQRVYDNDYRPYRRSYYGSSYYTDYSHSTS
jgi:hypothetical protein